MAKTPTEIDPASVQVTETDGKAKAIEGRSPWELFRARLLKDKPTLVVLGIVVFALVLAVLAPLLWKLGVINPTKGDISLLNIEEGSIPKAPWGGISAAHPFGVEPGTGADVLSRVIVGVSLSLVISLAAAFIAVGLGTVLGDEHLTVLERIHRARIDVEVGVQLLHRDLEPTSLEKGTQG